MTGSPKCSRGGGGEHGFDIIVGNPPYGASLSGPEKQYLKSEFDIGGTNTAALMIHQSMRLLRRGGMHGFIVPKSLMFASREWPQTRKRIVGDLVSLFDVGKVWAKVLLEQCIYIVRAGAGPKDSASYSSGIRDGDTLHGVLAIQKSHADLFGSFPSVSSTEEMDLGIRLARCRKLGDFVSNARGVAKSNAGMGKGGMPVVGGKNVRAYGISGPMDHADASIAGEKAVPAEGSVLVQNLVAHIMNPVDHIRVIGTIPASYDFLVIDTVNVLEAKDEAVSPHFVLGLLHSKIINWYVYRFLYSRSVRTMHFDAVLTDRIPFKVERGDEIADCVKALLGHGGGLPARSDVRRDLIKRLDGLFYCIFGLSEREIQMVENASGRTAWEGDGA